MRAQNVGIIASEMYFPKTYISQEDLETYNKVGKGKYTLGLGQKEMAFIQSFEDINSIGLTVVQNLLEKYSIDPKKIGRLEIGTETLLDKSKSIKTVLMQLFKDHKNHDIEGVTSINACYGGTAALFNTLAWVESSAWDGRYGIVVMADVAVYKKGPARPTGGCGAIALLIGPNAPLSIDSLRATYIDHAYDFYKPDPRSEYPTVDGHVSINTYIGAIDNCYNLLREKQQSKGEHRINLSNIDYACFHAPFGKMVQKAFTKIVHNDVLNEELKTTPEILSEIKANKFSSKPVQQHLGAISKQIWNEKVLPSLAIGSRIGNIYTGSLYAGLLSLLSNQQICSKLQGKRILMFSYGSGLASSMFTIRINRNIEHLGQVMNIPKRLDQRVKFDIDTFEEIMASREKAFGLPNFQPVANFNHLEEGAFYLTECDKMFRRKYERKPIDPSQRQVVDLRNYTWQTNNPNKNFEKFSNKQQQQQSEVIIVEKGMDRLEMLNQDMKTSSEKQQQQQSRSKSPSRHQKTWNGFYKKTMKERLDLISKIDHDLEVNDYLSGGLDLIKADVMVENCVGKISMPLGLGLNFTINNKQLQVPMAIEEPSVVAAASSAGKFISEIGRGFQTQSTDPIMIGQIQLLDVDSQLQIHKLQNHKTMIIEKANEFCQSMVKRGGGVKDIRVRQLHSTGKNLKSTGLYQVNSMAVVDLFINVCDSMGANITNTICEGIAPYIQEICGARIGIKILSNLCVERKAYSEFLIPVKEMAWKNASGEQVAQRIIESYRFAQLDPFRAATHNKGVMNGIDAVAIALGQDWRSIEASCHAYSAVENGTYQPLTHYEIIDVNGEHYFKGSLEVPISVGTKGGVIDNNKLYENNLRLLGFPNAQQMSEIMITVGLAQNFAALRALAIEGIQKGHMSLHAKNIAISAGVPAYLADDCARFMKKRGKFTGDIAKDYIQAYDLYGNVRKIQKQVNRKEVLSTFYVELNVPHLEEKLSLHMALDCSTIPIHVSMEKEQNNLENTEIHNKIIGEKGYDWLQKMFTSLEMVRLDFGVELMSSVKPIVPKLKLISILIDLITSNMLQYAPLQTREIVVKLQQNHQQGIRQYIEEQKDNTIKYGFSLLSELTSIFHYNIDQNTNNLMLKNELVTELFNISNSQIKSQDIWSLQQYNKQNYSEFFNCRKKRLCSTMMLLCDCLSIKESEVNTDLIETIKQLGSIYEIESTFAHDLKRWNPKTANKDLNVYTYYLKSNNQSLEIATQKQIVDQFIKDCYELISQKKLMISPRLNDRLQKLSQKTSEVIRNFYKIDQYEFTYFNVTNNNMNPKPRL